MERGRRAGRQGVTGRAIVIGSSFAGLLAARVLADHFSEVRILDAGHTAGPHPRRGVPQARHVHVLLTRGRLILQRLFPALEEQLISQGATLLDAALDVAWQVPQGWGVRFPSTTKVLTCPRDLLDWSLRIGLTSFQHVRFVDAVRVTGLLTEGGSSRVVGVRTASGDSGADVFPAALVVDASGRGSRMPQWLEAIGIASPEETVVDAGIGYASRIYRNPATDGGDWKAIVLHAAPPAMTRGGILCPLGNSGWLATMIGVGRDYPPADEDAFLDFARSLRSPLIYEAIRGAEALSPVSTYHATRNRLRHYERLARWPSGLAVVGDAVCALDPIYAQGMTTAALQAELMSEALRRGAVRLDMSGLQQKIAKVTASAWLLATTEDLRVRGVEGREPRAVDRVMHRYLDRVWTLTTSNPNVRRSLLEVWSMMRPPASLFHPRVLLPALLAGSRRRPRKGSAGPDGAAPLRGRKQPVA